MAITYESICKKLGFDPMEWKPEQAGHEDDSIKSPFAALSEEEEDFLLAYMAKNRKKSEG